MKKENNLIVVLGQRRSGTSMISGVLHKLGIPMGAPKDQSDRNNPKGYFEDRRFVFLSETMTAFMMGRWGGFTIDPGKKDSVKLRRYFGGWIKEVVKDRSIYGKTWGFKDVNHIMYEDVYRPFLPEPKYVLIERNSDAIANSLSKWHKKNPLDFKNAIDYYNSLLEKFITNTKDPLLILQYEDCIKDPNKAIKKIIEFTEINPTDEQFNDAIEHISPELNHYKK